MFIPHHDLRMHRKRSGITQDDLAYLFGLSAYKTIVRWESGLRQPEVEHLLSYHLLFNVPLESLLSHHVVSVSTCLQKRLNERIAHLKQQNEDKEGRRISFMNSALESLGASVV